MLLINNIGDSIEDLKWNYTIAQVWLLYEKCVKQEMDARLKDAIMLAQVGIYTSPTYDKAGANRKQRLWNDFIRGLTWSDVAKKRESTTTKRISTVLGGLGVKIRQRDGDQ